MSDNLKNFIAGAVSTFIGCVLFIAICGGISLTTQPPRTVRIISTKQADAISHWDGRITSGDYTVLEDTVTHKRWLERGILGEPGDEFTSK